MAEKITAFMDDAAAYLWQQFEKDMELTHAILDRTEKMWERIARTFKL